ncbi:hypothetical protein [Allomuricauda sp. SCSIO 64092]|nr:hypothetical protein [Muricauda sp. SCSIO 64092]
MWARTIADLESARAITGDNISEAIQYCGLDREAWFWFFVASF